MRLVDVDKFFLVKKRVPIVVEHLDTTDIGSINKILRQCFIGQGVDSISAKYKNEKEFSLMVQLRKGSAKVSFTFTFVPLKKRVESIVGSAIQEAIREVSNIFELINRSMT